MSPLVAFCTAVGATVAFLVAVVVTGLRGRVRIHIPCVAGALGSLATAIHFALELGTIYDLKAAGPITPIHLALAKIATAAYVLPLVTGIRTLRSRANKRTHFWAAMIVLALTAAASITGTLMLWWAPKLPG